MESPIIIEIMVSPSVGNQVVMNISTTDLGWIGPYIEFIKHGLIPDSNKLAIFKQRATYFVLLGGILFKKGYSTPLLRCVPSPKKEQIMEEVHLGICVNYDGIR